MEIFETIRELYPEWSRSLPSLTIRGPKIYTLLWTINVGGYLMNDIQVFLSHICGPEVFVYSYLEVNSKCLLYRKSGSLEMLFLTVPCKKTPKTPQTTTFNIKNSYFEDFVLHWTYYCHWFPISFLASKLTIVRKAPNQFFSPKDLTILVIFGFHSA